MFHHFRHRRPGWEHRPGVADYWFFFGLGSFGFSTSLLLLAVIRFRIIVFYRFLFFGLPSSLYWQHRRFRIFGRFWFWSSVGFESVFCYHRFLRHKQEIGFVGLLQDWDLGVAIIAFKSISRDIGKSSLRYPIQFEK